MNNSPQKISRLQRECLPFTRIPHWIIKTPSLRDITGSELKVLHYICAVMGNQTNRATLTRDNIAAKTGVSFGSISSIIRRLEQHGIILIEREGRTNSYLVLFTPPNSQGTTDIVPHPSSLEITRMHITNTQDYSTYSDSGLYEGPSPQPREEDTRLPPY